MSETRTTSYHGIEKELNAIDASTEKVQIVFQSKRTSDANEGKGSTKESECTQSLSESDTEPPPYLKGWRLYTVTAALCLGIFLSQLETTIVSTSLVSITNELEGFSLSSWVISAYLMTYTGFLMPLSKLSDIYGRRPVLVFSLVVFTAFSAGAGWSRNMVELCVFRAFQGIGGGGAFAMSFVLLPDLVPQEDYTPYTAVLSGVLLISNLLGPLLGGLISARTTWRWVFWLNLPAGAIAIILTYIGLPSRFPYQHVKARQSSGLRSLRRLDTLGFALLLSASTLFVAALEVGGTQYSWTQATPLSLLCIGILLWVLFFLWQWRQDRRPLSCEPLLPWRVLSDRFAAGIIVVTFFAGAAFIAALILMPIRFQILNALDPFDSGFRMLAYTLASPAGSILSGLSMQRLKVPPLWILLVGSIVQTAGFALMGGIYTSEIEIPAYLYGFEVLMGFGAGATISTTIMCVPLFMEKRDTAVAGGAIAQFRMLGGCIAVSSCANLLNTILIKDLSGVIDPELLDELLKVSTLAFKDLDGPDIDTIRIVYAGAFRRQMALLAAFSAACFISTFLLIERRPRRMT